LILPKHFLSLPILYPYFTKKNADELSLPERVIVAFDADDRKKKGREK